MAGQVREITNWDEDLQEASPAPPSAPPAPSPPHPDAGRIQAIAVLHGLASILAVRAILLIAVLGSLLLAFFAIRDATPSAMIASALSDALILIPLVVLAWRKG